FIPFSLACSASLRVKTVWGQRAFWIAGSSRPAGFGSSSSGLTVVARAGGFGVGCAGVTARGGAAGGCAAPGAGAKPGLPGAAGEQCHAEQAGKTGAGCALHGTFPRSVLGRLTAVLLCSMPVSASMADRFNRKYGAVISLLAPAGARGCLALTG